MVRYLAWSKIFRRPLIPASMRVAHLVAQRKEDGLTLGRLRNVEVVRRVSTAMNARSEQALELMMRFAERTGLTSQRPSQRYLWTDAFAVCNFLGLARTTGESRYSELALHLIDRVHRILGRHRPDDQRTGWISGLTAEHGEAHPTLGGLRIGKPLPERPADEPMDERLEWDRDGQYFHYLTKWMHALDQVTRSSGQGLFSTWARELAHTAHRAFTSAPPHGGPRRMYWKLSIDLSRPLVASMGQHDPLDGLVTYAQLEATAAGRGPSLADAIADFAAMVDPGGSPRATRSGSAACWSTRIESRSSSSKAPATSVWARPCTKRRESGSGSTSMSQTSVCPRRTVWHSASSGSRSDSRRSSETNGPLAAAPGVRVSLGCRDT